MYRMQNEWEKSGKSLADTLLKYSSISVFSDILLETFFSFVRVYTWYLNQYIFINVILTER